MTEQLKTCPHCAEEVKAEALKCKHCGEALKSNADEMGELVGAVLGLIALGFLAAWWFGAFDGDEPSPPPPKVPEGGVRYEGQIYSAWSSSRHSGIESALAKNDAYCPDYKYRKSLSYSSEYIVYCQLDYESGKAPVSAYIVFPRVGDVVGPTATDSRLN
jgi:hypothetical protein